MLKTEFEAGIDGKVDSHTYEIVETVYMSYPGFTSKEQVYALYRQFGLVIFSDMYNRASQIASLEKALQTNQSRLAALKLGAC